VQCPAGPTLWASPHSCNGREIRWNLRDPIKAAVAAVMEHIGGVLPTHVNYNIPRGRIEVGRCRLTLSNSR
jgi:hypothetical protein